jgi:hypothetical protein
MDAPPDRSLAGHAPDGGLVKTIVCFCGATATHDCGGQVGEAAKTTGFYPVLDNRAMTLWICPECVDKIKPHVEALYAIVPSYSAHWGSLLDLAGIPKP